MLRRSNSFLATVKVLTWEQSPSHMLSCKCTRSEDLASSSAVGQWPQDQSLTCLLCFNPDDRPVLWLVSFYSFLFRLASLKTVRKETIFCLHHY